MLNEFFYVNFSMRIGFAFNGALLIWFYADNEMRGTKRFDYIFVPEKSGTLELPEVSFSFFDPDVEKYVELTSPTIAVEVAPSNIPSALPSFPSDSNNENATTPPAGLARSLDSEELLQTLDYRLEKGRNVPSSSIFTSSFYSLNSGLLAIVSITAIWNYRRKRLLNSPHYELVRNAREELKIALSKTQSDDNTTFFRNAQKAIRLAATIRIKSNLRAADFTTMETHFRGINVTKDLIDQTRILFETAEAQQFSGHLQTVDLDEFRNQLKTILKALR